MNRILSRTLVFALAMLPLSVTQPGLPPLPDPAGAPAAEGVQDPRLHRLRKFFSRFGSPAGDYADVFLEVADSYRLDWRLLPSISLVESGGGRTSENNNLFGWDAGRAEFASPDAGIHAVAYHLTHARRYRDKTVDEKLAVYNSNTGYVEKVKSVMQRIAPSE